MILLDPSDGSKELAVPLREAKVEVVVTRLPFGDIETMGKGPEGRPVRTGIEYKKLGEFLNSVYSGRLVASENGQLPKLMTRYEYPILLLEGRMRADFEGRLEICKKITGGMEVWFKPAGVEHDYLAVRRMIHSIEAQGGVIVERTEDQGDTVQFIKAWDKWWSLGWDRHTTLHAFKQDPERIQLVLGHQWVRLVAAQLPDIEWKRSIAVAAHFPTVVDLANAPQSEWVKIKGVGRIIADKVYRALRGRY